MELKKCMFGQGPWGSGAAYFDSRRSRVQPHSGLQVSKRQNVSSPLIRNDSILWGASVTER